MATFSLALNVGNVSIKGAQARLVAAMLAQSMLYDEAVRQFQSAYINYVVAGHKGHLGNAASELGMHRNTLTRTLKQVSQIKHQ
jgi:Fis family transcriptional regulator